AGKLTNLDFPKFAKDQFGILAVEYVNGFWKDKGRDQGYLKDLKGRCDGEGVYSNLIMVDGEGAIGEETEAGRLKTIEQHKQWVEAAKFLGCRHVRVNAQSKGSYEEQMDRAADGLARLGAFAKDFGINIIVENHGGLSSNGKWLSGVIKKVGMANVGTLPDFGNFHEYDRYLGVQETMPFARAVSAKSHDFDDAGNETKTDYSKMMRIVVKEHHYHDYVGIEYEGGRLGEVEGVRATLKLLERCRAELAKDA
ncbi:MAG: TIM barrel protein, partial [Kiritimatiellia bacterium]